MKTYGVILAALADPTRRAIFERLRRGSSSVAELAEGFPVSRPAVSQHLKVLKEANLVRDQRRGTRHFYDVNPSGLDPLRNYLEDFWGGALAAFKAVADETQGGTHNG